MSRHDVVILGGGPAGLSAAKRLGELGIRDVALIEREGELGGVPRHCGHLAFGLRERVPTLRVDRLGARRAPVAPSPVLEAFIIPSAEGIARSARGLLANATPKQGRQT